MRDEFPIIVKNALAKRVGMRCSNPHCQKPTSGPRKDPSAVINIGVAAHIAAASAGGPRFNSEMSAAARQSVENGIWLCQNCAKLVDDDAERFPESLLRFWKTTAEQRALAELRAEGERAKGSPAVRLAPASQQNWVHLGPTKFKRNASFGYSAEFHLITGPETLSLVSFNGLYFAYGCPCLNSWPQLALNGDKLEFHSDLRSLKRPYPLAVQSVFLLEYARELRPPLMRDSPADCDLGDLEVILGVIETASTTSRQDVFRFAFREGGRLEPIMAVRSPPRLQDKELAQHRQDGRISEEIFEKLLQIPPDERYMAARSDNVHWGDMPDYLRQVLRTLLDS
jgi:hypothetical protein